MNDKQWKSMKINQDAAGGHTTPQTPPRGPLLARQNQGLRFGGGNRSLGARFARSRTTVTGPNPKPWSWLAASTGP